MDDTRRQIVTELLEQTKQDSLEMRTRPSELDAFRCGELEGWIMVVEMRLDRVLKLINEKEST